jgi:hypothetical protein
MSELTFAQTKHRSFLVPTMIAVAVLGLVVALAYLEILRQTASINVTHVAILPTHTVFKSYSKVVGHVDPFVDELYVLATVRVDNRLRTPLFLKDITATHTGADDSVATTSAVEEYDLASLYTTFPALKTLASAPLARESAIQRRTTLKAWSCSTSKFHKLHGNNVRPPPLPWTSTTKTPSPSPSPNPNSLCLPLTMSL